MAQWVFCHRLDEPKVRVSGAFAQGAFTIGRSDPKCAEWYLLARRAFNIGRPEHQRGGCPACRSRIGRTPEKSVVSLWGLPAGIGSPAVLYARNSRSAKGTGGIPMKEGRRNGRALFWTEVEPFTGERACAAHSFAGRRPFGGAFFCRCSWFCSFLLSPIRPKRQCGFCRGDRSFFGVIPSCGRHVFGR